MKLFIFTVISIFSVSALASSPELSCYTSIAPYTAGPTSTDMSNVTGFGSTLFRGQHDGLNKSTNEGLYLLMDTSACFFRFTSAPATDKESDYSMKLDVTKADTVFITYQSIPNGYPAVSWSSAALPGLTYVETVCEDTTDTSGIAAIDAFLAAKIDSAPDRYKLNLMACQEGVQCYTKQQFINALSSCKVSAVQTDIANAIKALNSIN